MSKSRLHRVSPPIAHHRVLRLIAASLLVAASLASALVAQEQAARAATDAVSDSNNSGPGSLRSAVAGAASGDTVIFSVDCPSSSPITLDSAIEVNTDLTIDGPGAGQLVLDGVNLDTDHAVAAISIPPNITATISGVSIDNAQFEICGFDVCMPGGGQAILNEGTLVVTDSTLSGNTEGIQNVDGTLTVMRSTLSNNLYAGSAIASWGTLDVQDTTFYENWTAISVESGTAIVSNTTIAADNVPLTVVSQTGASTTLQATIVATVDGDDGCFGSVIDGGYNLDTGDTCGFTASTSQSNVPAGLDPGGLQNNGGPTETIALEPGSSAIGAVKSATLCSRPDQRGLPRPLPCDMGAFQSGNNFSNGNLTDAYLAGFDLTGANLFNADLTGADLTGATLTDANLTDANLSNANLTGVISGGIVGVPSALPQGWTLVDGQLIDSDATTTMPNLQGADLSGNNLSGANLEGANLGSADLFNADLTNADLSLANLTGANLTDANLSGADLTGVRSGGIIGAPSVLPTGSTLVDGLLVGPTPP